MVVVLLACSSIFPCLQCALVYPHHLMVRPAEQANKGCGEADVGGFVSRARTGAGDGKAAVSLPHPYRDINLELWTQKFVGGSGNLDAMFLDAFLPNETFANRAELYPNKLLNLQRRALRLGSITYVPYTVTNYVVSNCRLSLYLSLLSSLPSGCCLFVCCSCCCCRHAHGVTALVLLLLIAGAQAQMSLRFARRH